MIPDAGFMDCQDQVHGVGSVRTLLSPWTWTGLGLNKKELQEKKDVEMNRDTVATVT